MKYLATLSLMIILSVPAIASEKFAEGLAAMDTANASKDSKHEGYADAFNIFGDLAEQGHPGAKYHLGILHFYGLGGARFDQARAIELIRHAAEGDYYQAQSLMGLMIEKSDGTMVSTNPADAVAWYEKAASAGHCVSIRRLATAYRDGELGLQKSEKISEMLTAQESTCKKR
ncbi:MAG: SEL1-like repeat protein [Gammaproteobacteria bacterium]|nr:SEL1-like repeat protein [Gammaproteobacteria bacterium]